MPKSRHRKNQKKKSKARTQKIKGLQKSYQQKLEAEFQKQIEELKEKQLEIKEVGGDEVK